MASARLGVSTSASAVIKEFIAATESKSVSTDWLRSLFIMFIPRSLVCLCVSTVVKGLNEVPPQLSFKHSINPSVANVMANLLAIFASTFASLKQEQKIQKGGSKC
ncbi:hypothetical protein J8L98_02125 [Pseudoalteromonas sp. MMG013]|uniref:hypothetical protein n=1 Tax=Pseudoalteromonas sp. MMG013 TaxID=2822687 RepID=UPI001B35E033|nr:hypothetical protein [Pseudoalteromonas sp. MMG013]MBQ4860489.1 hypothetical protein [Pseudoalteromonas sp. MMG013]